MCPNPLKTEGTIKLEFINPNHDKFMKKIKCQLDPTFSFLWRSKFIRTMKVFCFIMVVSIMQVLATNAYSQDARLSLNMKNVSAKTVLQQIEDKTQYFFIYDASVVDVEKRVNIDVENQSIEKILDKLFEGTNVVYKINNRQIALSTDLPSSTAQQQRSVSGKVSDSFGAPLPGVTVLVKNTNKGVITDVDGVYHISNIPNNAVLVFSFVGMKSQEVSVSGKNQINVVLTDESVGLEEVVAVGYGTMKKSDLTGSVVKVDMAGKENTSSISISQALQGYVSGVNASSGALAGSSGSISIRGQTSLSASDTPLIVIDGAIFHGSFADLNINDIESIDVLKDASAAAVYGSKSANGVIIITSKKGKSEKPLFNFNMSFGFQDISPTKRTHVMNGDQYAVRLVDYYYQQALNTWYKTSPTDETGRPTRIDISDRNLVSTYLRSTEEQENYLAGKEVNWIDEVTRTAPIQNYNLSVSGKTDRTNYYLSASYVNQKGVLLNDNFKRTTLMANFENKITNWLSMGLNTSYSHLDYSGVEADMGYALNASPLGNVTDENGDYTRDVANESVMRHPLGNTLPIDDVDLGEKLNILFTAKVNIPKVKGLVYEINYSRYLNFGKNNDYYPASTYSGVSYNGLATKKHTEEKDWLVNNIVTYNKTIDKHKINATLLYSRENRVGESSELTSYGFDITTLGYNSMELGSTQSVASGAWEENSISYMARINYTYNDRYLLTSTIRRDGFSGFGTNKKFANFPSVSLGWIASEESFMKNLTWLNFLKLRLSYGLNGNQGIGRYASLAQMSSDNYVFGGTTAIGIYSSSLGNSDLGWESTSSFNLGLDYAFLNQRISGSIDLYKAKTSDVLVERALSSTTGYSSVYQNIGGIENKGIEFSLVTRNIKTRDFNWESRFSFSINRNKITKLYEGVTEDIGNSWFVGKPINSIYNYKTDGIWQEKDLFNGNIISGYYPGMFKLKDMDDSGTITAAADRSVIGNKDPNFRFSINNTLSYKNFTFSFFINSIQGGNGYYIGENSEALVAGGTDYAYRENRTAVRAYWTPTNPVNNAPAMYYSPPVSHGVYQEKSFVRLQDVTFAYDIKQALLKKYGFNNFQFYLSGKNLYTWTKWAGWDPETSSPMMRSVIAGIKLSF
jgi:TonB-dependent starch-binding outer membrane protein SusC